MMRIRLKTLCSLLKDRKAQGEGLFIFVMIFVIILIIIVLIWKF